MGGQGGQGDRGRRVEGQVCLRRLKVACVSQAVFAYVSAFVCVFVCRGVGVPLGGGVCV